MFSQPALLSWTSPTSPVFINVHLAGQVSTPLEQLGEFSGDSTSWTVNVEAGKSVMFRIGTNSNSSSGLVYSDPVTVQIGNDSSCGLVKISAGHPTAELARIGIVGALLVLGLGSFA